jgi:hypothetical protein
MIVTGEAKITPVRDWRVPLGTETSRFPYFLENNFADRGHDFSLITRPLFAP